MANISISVDSINDFVIENFIPYSWCYMWETTEPAQLGDFKFIMTIRPNVIERNEFHHKSGLIHKITSSNSGEFLPPEYYSCYCLEIPMLLGSSLGKRGKILNHDHKLKSIYVEHLRRYIWFGIEKLHGIAEPIMEKDNLFGSSYSRVKSWLDGKHRSEWAFILS